MFFYFCFGFVNNNLQNQMTWKYLGTHSGNDTPDTTTDGVQLPSEWNELNIIHYRDNTDTYHIITISKTMYDDLIDIDNAIVERWGHYYTTSNCLQASFGINRTCVYSRTFNLSGSSSVSSTIKVYYR